MIRRTDPRPTARSRTWHETARHARTGPDIARGGASPTVAATRHFRFARRDRRPQGLRRADRPACVSSRGDGGLARGVASDLGHAWSSSRSAPRRSAGRVAARPTFVVGQRRVPDARHADPHLPGRRADDGPPHRRPQVGRGSDRRLRRRDDMTEGERDGRNPCAWGRSFPRRDHGTKRRLVPHDLGPWNPVRSRWTSWTSCSSRSHPSC